MNRQETVSLLKEMIAVCGSFYDARAVSVQNGGNSDNLGTLMFTGFLIPQISNVYKKYLLNTF